MRANRLTPIALFLCAFALLIVATRPSDATSRAEVTTIDAIASCDFRAITEDLIASPRFADGREELRRSLETPAIVSMRERERALSDRMDEAEAAGDDELWERLWNEWDVLTDELWPREWEIERRLSERLAKDAAAAYEAATGVAREVADELGYDAVVQITLEPLYAEPEQQDDENAFNAEESAHDAVHRRFAQRPIPVLPDDIDITGDVRYELGLD